MILTLARGNYCPFQRQLRSERAIAYSDFAEAVRMDLRGWDNWWFRKHRSRRRRHTYDALMKAYDLDSATYHALRIMQNPCVRVAHRGVTAGRRPA